jgi:FkbM family methyltransferase
MAAHLKNLTIAAGVTSLICVAVLYSINPQFGYWVYRCVAGADSKIACIYGDPSHFRTTTLGSVYEGNTADWIDRRVLLYGAYEMPELFFLRDVSSGGVMLDIGANKGLYSLFLSKYQKEIHAFEPFPPILEQLRKHVAANDIKNIIIHPVGLGDKNERLPFKAPVATNQGVGSFAFVSGDYPHDSLEVQTGDQALQTAGVAAVDLIKMDIEGFERPALRGLVETLARSRPIVLFELNLRPQGAMLFQSMEQLASAFPPNYKLSILKTLNPYTGEYQLVPADGAINFSSETGEQHNIVAFPVDQEHRVPLRGPVKR